MTKPALRTVKPDEKPAKPTKPKNVEQAAKTGSHRDLLVAMRDRIAVAVSDQDCPPRDLAALTRRLQDIAREIEQIDLRAEEEAEEAEGAEDEAWNPEAI